MEIAPKQISEYLWISITQSKADPTLFELHHRKASTLLAVYVARFF